MCVAGEAAYGLEFISATLDKSTDVLAVTFDADVNPDSVDATKFHIREQGSATGGIALTGSAVTTNGTRAFLALTDAHKTMLEEIDRPRLAIDRAAITDSTGDPFDATFDISTAFFLDSTSVHVADTGSDGLEFNNDGTRMFIGDYANPVREYALSVAFDASTASFLGNSDELSDSVGYFAFNSNGSRLFVSLNDGLIGQYDMPAPFDISNLTFAGSLDVSENDSFLFDILFGADGNNLFVAGGDNGQIYQYRLSTPFDLSGASHVASLELQEGTPMSLAFGSGGTRMIVLNDKDEIFQYVVPVAFNLTGVRYDDTSFDLLNSENGNLTSSYGLALSNDGTKMFVVDSPDHFTVAEYILGTFEVGVTNDPAPQLLSIEGADPVDMTTNRLTLVFNVTFSEDVTGVDAGDFALSPDSTGGGSASGRFTQISAPATPITDYSTIQDAITVGPSGTATAVSVAVDITHTFTDDLTVQLVAPDGTVQALHGHAGDPANDIDLTYTPYFGGTEIAGDWILRVSDRAGGDTGTLNSWTLTMGYDGAGGSVTGLTGSGATYLVTVSATRDGTYNLDVAQDGGIADAADNPLAGTNPTGADHTYAVDTAAPTVTSIVRGDPAEATTSERILVFAVTFSEDVTGVDAGDFALSPDSTGTGSIVGLTGFGSQYLVAVSAARDGTYNLDVAQNGGIADAADNPLASTAPTGADHTYAVDTAAPTVTSIVRGDPAEATTSERILVFAVTFSEDVTGVDAGDFALSPDSTGTGSIVGLTGFGSQYLVAVSAARDGTYNLDVAQNGGIADAADNPLAGTNPTGADHTYAVDTAAPTVTSIVRSDPAGEATFAQTLVFAVTFSEDVTGVDAGDFAPSPDSTGGGSASGQFTQTSTPALAIPDNAPAVSDTITVTRAGTATAVSVAVDITHTFIGDLTVELIAPDGTVQTLHDHAGGSASDIDRTYTPDFDGTGITGDWILRVRDDAGADTGALNGWALTIGYDGADNPVTGLTGSGATYLVTVSSAQNGTYNLDIAQDSDIADAADNPLAGTNPTGADHTYTVSTIPADTTAPAVTSIERSDPAEATTSERILVFAVTFSEDVTGVDAGDFAPSPDSTGGGSASGRFTQTSAPATPITDYSTIQDAITVGPSGTATAVSVAVDITHTFIGDLTVELIAPDGTVQTLHDHAGGLANDIDRTYTPDFDGTGIAGDWILRVSDRTGGDTGTLNSWTLTIDHGGADNPVTGLTGSGATYLVTVSSAQNGTYNLDIAQDSDIADAADNPLAGTNPTGADHTYTVSTIPADTAAPAVTSIVRSDPAEATTSERTLVFAVTFSEDVTGVDAGDFALSPDSTGTGSVTSLAGTGSRYLVNVSAARDGTYNLDVAQDGGIADAADNPLAGTNPTGADHTYAVDTAEITVHDGPDDSDFVTTWETGEPGESVTIPARGTYTVDWGDGTVDVGVSGIQTHAYDAAGNHTVRVSKGITGFHLDGHSDAGKLRSVDQWGDAEWASMRYSFKGASNMVLHAADVPDLSRVTDMKHMFKNAQSFDGDVSAWDVSGVTNMDSMFRGATSFNKPLSSWNVSQVTYMHGMFSGASSFNQDLNDWDVSRMIYMYSMFRDATSFNQSLSSWNVSQVTRMPNMFHAAAAFNGDLSSWDVSSVTNMDSMFRGATSFNKPLSSWNVSQVINMNNMFSGATSFNKPLSSWDVSKVTGMSGMFRDATSFNKPLSSWDVSKVTGMSGMFRDATSFNKPLSSWNVSQVINMNNMFSGASSFNGNVSSWNVSRVTYMHSMFSDATSFNQDLNDWDVSKVTGMSGMFRDATSFNKPLSSWNVSRVTNMISMFYAATSFNGNVSSWDVSKVDDMSSMFDTASSFNRDLNDWNVSQVDDMNSMFYGATAFNGNVSSWDVSKVDDMSSMFDTASSFNRDLNDWNVSQVDDMNSMFYGASSFNQPLNDWDVSSVTNMDGMFSGASDFDQNLGNWYVTINSTSIDRADVSGTVGTISAQNAVLDGHGPVYGIASGADSDRFEIDGSLLIMNSTDADKDSYTVNVNAPGDSVFEDGNNWSALTVTLTGSANTPPTVTSIVRSDPAEATTSERTLVFAVTFSEDVTGVDAGDFALSPDSTGTGSVTSLAGTGSRYLVNVSAARDGTYNLDVAQDGGIADAADNPLAGTNPTGADHTYAVDTAEITVHDGPDDSDFVTTWETGEPGESVTIPARGTYTVDWGDGTVDVGVSGIQTHAYDAAGNHTVRVSKGITGFHLDGHSDAGKLRSVDQWGDAEWASMRYSFKGASNMVLHAADVPDLSRVTDMKHMFKNAQSFDGDVSAWDVSGVTNMAGAFLGAISFDGDVSAWDVSSVVKMSDMFRRASSFDGDVSAWNVSSVVKMSDMFRKASSFDGDVSAWDVSSVTDMRSMFHRADAFDQNLGSWYIVLDDASVYGSSVPGEVGRITAQNLFLDGQNPRYAIGSGGDSDHFEIDGDSLRIKSVPGHAGSYTVNITSTGAYGDSNSLLLGVVVLDGSAPGGEPETGPREIGGLALSGTNPLMIHVSWDEPDEAPKDYRIKWAKVGEPYLKWWKSSGNAFPTGPSHVITGLEEGEEYKVQVRARYHSGGPGPWSGEITIPVARSR